MSGCAISYHINTNFAPLLLRYAASYHKIQFLCIIAKVWCTIIKAADIAFQYSGKEGMYTKVIDHLTGNVFLATSKDYEFLLSYRNTALCTSTDSRRSSQNYVDNPSSDTAVYSLEVMEQNHHFASCLAMSHGRPPNPS